MRSGKWKRKTGLDFWRQLQGSKQLSGEALRTTGFATRDGDWCVGFPEGPAVHSTFW